MVQARKVMGVGRGRGEQEWEEGKEAKLERHGGPRLLTVRVSDVNFCCCLPVSLSFPSEIWKTGWKENGVQHLSLNLGPAATLHHKYMSPYELIFVY